MSMLGVSLRQKTLELARIYRKDPPTILDVKENDNAKNDLRYIQANNVRYLASTKRLPAERKRRRAKWLNRRPSDREFSK